MAEREVVVTYRLQQDPRNAQTMREMAGSARDVSAKKDRDREFEDFQRFCVRKGAMEVREEQRAAQEGLRIRAAVARERNRMAQEEQRAQERAIALSERASRAQEVANRRVMTYSTRALGGAISMGRGFALLGILDEKDNEAMLKAFIKIEAGFSILRGGVSTVVNLSKAWEAVGREARAAAAAQAAGVAASSGGSVLAMLARLGPYGLVAAAIAAAAYGTYSLGTSGPQRDADRAEKETEEFAERHASAQAISDRRIASMRAVAEGETAKQRYADSMREKIGESPAAYQAEHLGQDYRSARARADASRMKMSPDREADEADAQRLHAELLSAQDDLHSEMDGRVAEAHAAVVRAQLASERAEATARNPSYVTSFKQTPLYSATDKGQEWFEDVGLPPWMARNLFYPQRQAESLLPRRMSIQRWAMSDEQKKVWDAATPTQQEEWAKRGSTSVPVREATSYNRDQSAITKGEELQQREREREVVKEVGELSARQRAEEIANLKERLSLLTEERRTLEGTYKQSQLELALDPEKNATARSAFELYQQGGINAVGGPQGVAKLLPYVAPTTREKMINEIIGASGEGIDAKQWAADIKRVRDEEEESRAAMKKAKDDDIQAMKDHRKVVDDLATAMTQLQADITDMKLTTKTVEINADTVNVGKGGTKVAQNDVGRAVQERFMMS